MEQSNLSSWAQYLKEPLVLIGFVIMLIAGIFENLLKNKIFNLSKQASERVFKQVLLYAFILGVLVVIAGFGLAIKKESKAPQKSINQNTSGGQSPAVVGNDVTITYGSSQKKEGKTDGAANPGKKEPTKSSGNRTRIEQKTSGKQSPAVVSEGDVNIKYENK